MPNLIRYYCFAVVLLLCIGCMPVAQTPVKSVAVPGGSVELWPNGNYALVSPNRSNYVQIKPGDWEKLKAAIEEVSKQ